jgi:hypothetical protein
MKKLKTIIFITLLAITVNLASSTPVHALGRNQHFLTFFYSQHNQSFTAMTTQNSGQFRTESMYSNLNTRNPGFILNSKLEVDGMMAENSYHKTMYPYTFPEFEDVDGAEDDKGHASSIGQVLINNLNNTIKHVLKPVSTAGREELEINLGVYFLRMAAAISNSAFQAIESNSEIKANYEKLE